MSSFDFDYWHIKVLYDLAGYLVAFVAAWFFYKKVFTPGEIPNPWKDTSQKYNYYLWILAGAMIGGTLISTFDGAMIPGHNPEGGLLISKSILGALFGGILTAEIYKKIHHIYSPTGILFLPGILLGVLVGRIGALMIGIRDFTYGLPTNLPWGMDFGDGVLRHPTMIYEVILLGIFFIVLMLGLYSKKRQWWIHNGFYLFIITYTCYRFFVGFIQPYSTWWWGLSTYQIISIVLIGYGGWMIRKGGFNSQKHK